MVKSAADANPARSEQPFAVEPAGPDAGFYYRCTRVLAAERSAYQLVEIVDTPAFGRALRLDGMLMASERDDFFYHESLVHPALAAHPSPREVLVIGGGDGGAAREALRHACVERLTLVELDAAVVRLSERYLPAVHGGAFSDPRARVCFEDGRRWLEADTAGYDAIVLDLTDPVGAAHDLYTADFYATCRRRLAPGGILALHAESPVTLPRTFARIIATLRSVFPAVRPYFAFVPGYGMWMGMATASADIDPAAVPAATVDGRLRERRVEGLRLYNGAMHSGAFAQPNFVREALERPVPVVTAADRLDTEPEIRALFDPARPGL